MVYRLYKALYGLKQAPRAFFALVFLLYFLDAAFECGWATIGVDHDDDFDEGEVHKQHYVDIELEEPIKN
ncbi:unnamed protein product [Lathyrus oleraceus]